MRNFLNWYPNVTNTLTIYDTNYSFERLTNSWMKQKTLQNLCWNIRCFTSFIIIIIGLSTINIFFIHTIFYILT